MSGGRQRITRGGLLFSVAVVMVGIAAVVSANNLLFLILAAMLSTLLTSGLVSRLCLAALELDFVLPEHVTAGREFPARLHVRNLKAWMPSFSVVVRGIEDEARPVLTSSVYFPLVPGRATLEETLAIRFGRRGAYRQNSFLFSTRFPFGFLEKTARVKLQRELVVYPSIEAQPGFEELFAGMAGEMETHYRGLGRDFYRIRPYQAFESARHVDWKATAHTGDLQVREFAREQEQTVELYLDLDVPPGMEAWFERAVDYCAFATWQLAQKSTGILLHTHDVSIQLPEQGDIYTILKYLALVEPRQFESPEVPIDENAYQIVLTAAPHRFVEVGWGSARIVGPDDFPIQSAGATGATSRAET